MWGNDNKRECTKIDDIDGLTIDKSDIIKSVQDSIMVW